MGLTNFVVMERVLVGMIVGVNLDLFVETIIVMVVNMVLQMTVVNLNVVQAILVRKEME